MAKKTDLRVLKTQKAIKEAFLSLIQKKGFEAVTIQDIAEEAMINRATFYLHYEDKYDLLEQISHTYLKELMEVMNISFHLQNGEVNVKRFKITLRRVFENIEENRFFYEVMLGPNGIAGFTNKIEKFLFEKFKENFKVIVGDLNNLNIPADFILNFISSAYIGVVKWWLSEDTRYSPEYMAEHLAEVITKGPMNAIGYKINFKEEDSD
ncbi:TetR/AcrR family transcriptional regulator [Domibacillus sp. DTU_2020_1001157_1_SI_ALB_TIR_016]|uniref:TetR/AcrR family transcriptional regulator n=1 Tax=Domibacillus sp. DTU_2020_1001157_1_SI_ALB_TIR_016 TaxID=3077789 RepID=UPI0028ED7917|nr:TetR/AcrR family transcriptional regulator [Domibacillus sp. DTU_2020_1001157_1_SI_ALB_TIR_016]WNS77905.1 TetR/AcrR family transcriptional regulator [Domibacillus sp. DTU_2020_1001157_1_SI_ALB_TIR_016]